MDATDTSRQGLPQLYALHIPSLWEPVCDCNQLWCVVEVDLCVQHYPRTASVQMHVKSRNITESAFKS